MWLSLALFRIGRRRVMRRNNFSRTSREVEALLDHIDELEATVQTHLRRRSGR